MGEQLEAPVPQCRPGRRGGNAQECIEGVCSWMLFTYTSVCAFAVEVRMDQFVANAPCIRDECRPGSCLVFLDSRDVRLGAPDARDAKHRLPRDRDRNDAFDAIIHSHGAIAITDDRNPDDAVNRIGGIVSSQDIS